MKSMSPRSLALLSRTAAALLGGYALTCASVIFLGAVLPLPKSQAILAASLTSFAVYTAVIVWVFATPNVSKGLISVLDLDTWKLIKEIPTEGPGFFMRSQANSPYAWTDVFFGPNNDAVHLIDKQTLEVAHTLRPMPGKNAAHVEFTNDGRYALLSVWDTDGALIVYDANTLEEVKRIPMNKPSGKYNVGNKIEFAEGTSH